MLTFEPIEHRYQWRGAVVPSVTQILAPLYDFSMVSASALEYARQRGIAVHACVKLDIQNDLVEESVAPELAGYLKAWRKFRADCRITDADFGEPEHPLYHATYGFAGTPDVPLFLNKRWAVLDVKTAEALSPVWPLQLAAYQELINENTQPGQRKALDRYSLRLREDGTYRLEQSKDRNDWPTFLAMLTVHRWRETHIKGD